MEKIKFAVPLIRRNTGEKFLPLAEELIASFGIGTEFDKQDPRFVDILKKNADAQGLPKNPTISQINAALKNAALRENSCVLLPMTSQTVKLMSFHEAVLRRDIIAEMRKAGQRAMNKWERWVACIDETQIDQPTADLITMRDVHQREALLDIEHRLQQLTVEIAGLPGLVRQVHTPLAIEK